MSLGSLLPCLTTLPVKKVVLISNLNLAQPEAINSCPTVDKEGVLLWAGCGVMGPGWWFYLLWAGGKCEEGHPTLTAFTDGDV